MNRVSERRIAASLQAKSSCGAPINLQDVVRQGLLPPATPCHALNAVFLVYMGTISQV